MRGNPRWYHTIDLGPGETTPGMVDLRRVAPKVLPQRLSGRALDIGTFDGFWAFELEKRGVSEVVAIDVADAGDAEWPPLQRERLQREADALGVEMGLGFRIAADSLRSKAERRVGDIRTLSPDAVGGPVDIGFLGSLLLHMRDPVGALERVRETVSGTLFLLEPVSVAHTLRAPRRPSAAYQPLTTTFNWWLPNLAALRTWIHAAGFDRVAFRGFHKPGGIEGTSVWHAAFEAS
jgi:hypothetical protein